VARPILDTTRSSMSVGQLHPRKLDGVQEPHLIAVACKPGPKGRARWSLRLLADKLVELEVVEDISYETLRQTSFISMAERAGGHKLPLSPPLFLDVWTLRPELFYAGAGTPTSARDATRDPSGSPS
jgi:hypothetical protein